MRDPLPLEDILDHAWRYFDGFYEAHGHYPTRLRVSHEAYRRLAHAPASAVFQWTSPCDARAGVMTLFGMEVYTTQRLPWPGRMPTMRHVPMETLGGQSSAAKPPMTSVPHCETPLPDEPCTEIACPCGEVIWDLRGVWPHLQPPAGPRLDAFSPADMAWQRLGEFRPHEIDLTVMRTTTEERVCAALGIIPYGAPGFHNGDPVAEPPCGAVDSEASSDAEWEAAVHDLIAQAQARRRP